MKESTKSFICSNCNHRASKWLGRCPECQEWNVFEPLITSTQIKNDFTPNQTETTSLTDINISSVKRIHTTIKELDRTLGGGLVPNSITVFGGHPGVGKSTLMLQLAGLIGKQLINNKILYVSAEESLEQVGLRASRLSVKSDNINIWCGNDLDILLPTLEQMKAVLIIVDSLQSLGSSSNSFQAGSVNAVKYVTQRLSEWARSNKCIVILIAHVTKEGSIAGPHTIEHLVDTVLHFETGTHDLRLLSTSKNRFGSIEEVGIFRMNEKGLIEVKNPNSLFLVERNNYIPIGTTVAPIYEGSRVITVELQCLVTPAKGSMPRIFSDRIDIARISRLAAVLERHTKTPITGMDIYVNVAGGIRVKDVAADLPLSLAMYSAVTEKPIKMIFGSFGEVSLAGEIRPVTATKQRVQALIALGYQKVITPSLKTDDSSVDKTVKTDSIIQAVTLIS